MVFTTLLYLGFKNPRGAQMIKQTIKNTYLHLSFILRSHYTSKYYYKNNIVALYRNR